METSPSILAALCGALTLLPAQAPDKKTNVLIIWCDYMGGR